MKIIITRAEIRSKFRIPADAILEIPHERKSPSKPKKKVEAIPEQTELPM